MLERGVDNAGPEGAGDTDIRRDTVTGSVSAYVPEPAGGDPDAGLAAASGSRPRDALPFSDEPLSPAAEAVGDLPTGTDFSVRAEEDGCTFEQDRGGLIYKGLTIESTSTGGPQAVLLRAA